MKYSQPSTPEEDALWERMAAHQGEEFRTSKGLTFTYTIRGSEMFVSRKDKSITRATVNVAYGKARELIDCGEIIDGPKKLGTFGASYLYPVFLKIGAIPPVLSDTIPLPIDMCEDE